MKMYKNVLVTLFVVCAITKFGAAENSEKLNSDEIKENFNFECANNPSCLNRVSKAIISRIKNRQEVDLGFVRIEPVERKAVTGRSSTILDFLSGYAVKFAVGPMVFGVQRSEQYDNYIELALLKKSNSGEGRQVGGVNGLQGVNTLGALGGIGGVGSDRLDGSLLGTALGGGLQQGQNQGGLGHQHMNNNNHNHNRRPHDRKYMQMMIPGFMAVNAGAWMLLAMGIVKMLTFKALIISKLAFIISMVMTVRKLMEHRAEKQMMPPHPYDWSGMMPYHMEYPTHHFHAHDIAPAVHAGPEVSYPYHHTSIIDSSNLHE